MSEARKRGIKNNADRACRKTRAFVLRNDCRAQHLRSGGDYAGGAVTAIATFLTVFTDGVPVLLVMIAMICDTAIILTALAMGVTPWCA